MPYQLVSGKAQGSGEGALVQWVGEGLPSAGMCSLVLTGKKPTNGICMLARVPEGVPRGIRDVKSGAVAAHADEHEGVEGSRQVMKA